MLHPQANIVVMCLASHEGGGNKKQHVNCVLVSICATRKQQQQQRCQSSNSRVLRAMARSSKHSSARLEQQGHAAAAKKWLTPAHREVSNKRQSTS
jgi:hypothetical protein